jgi:hypothetical protein
LQYVFLQKKYQFFKTIEEGLVEVHTKLEILYIITNMVSIYVSVCPFLSFRSYLPLPNLPKLLFTERQLGSYNKKKKSQ